MGARAEAAKKLSCSWAQSSNEEGNSEQPFQFLHEVAGFAKRMDVLERMVSVFMTETARAHGDLSKSLKAFIDAESSSRASDISDLWAAIRKESAIESSARTQEVAALWEAIRGSGVKVHATRYQSPAEATADATPAFGLPSIPALTAAAPQVISMPIVKTLDAQPNQHSTVLAATPAAAAPSLSAAEPHHSSFQNRANCGIAELHYFVSTSGTPPTGSSDSSAASAASASNELRSSTPGRLSECSAERRAPTAEIARRDQGSQAEIDALSKNLAETQARLKQDLSNARAAATLAEQRMQSADSTEECRTDKVQQLLAQLEEQTQAAELLARGEGCVGLTAHRVSSPQRTGSGPVVAGSSLFPSGTTIRSTTSATLGPQLLIRPANIQVVRAPNIAPSNVTAKAAW